MVFWLFAIGKRNGGGNRFLLKIIWKTAILDGLKLSTHEVLSWAAGQSFYSLQEQEPEHRKMYRSDLQPLVEEINKLRAGQETGTYDILGLSSAAIDDMINKKIKRFVNMQYFADREIKHFNFQHRKQKNGTPYTLYVAYLPDRLQLTSTTEEGLYEKLYNYYTGAPLSARGQKQYTIEALYPKYLKWKSEENVTGKTIQIREQNWRTYYKDTDIVKEDIRKLKLKDWTAFYKKLVKERHMSQKCFINVKSLMRQLYEYAIEEEIVEVNVVANVINRRMPFTETGIRNAIKAEPFQPSEMDAIEKWCRSEMEKPRVKKQYYYIILFNVRMGLRFGELAAIRWSDINFDERSVYVCGQMLDTVEVVELEGDRMDFKVNHNQRCSHMKSGESTRRLRMPEETCELLREVRQHQEELGIQSEYVFPVEAEYLRKKTLNDKIKALAEHLGKDPTNDHAHSLRATAACNKYHETNDLLLVKAFLGHRQVAMTEQYTGNLNVIG